MSLSRVNATGVRQRHARYHGGLRAECGHGVGDHSRRDNEQGKHGNGQSANVHCSDSLRPAPIHPARHHCRVRLNASPVEYVRSGACKLSMALRPPYRGRMDPRCSFGSACRRRFTECPQRVATRRLNLAPKLPIGQSEVVKVEIPVSGKDRFARRDELVVELLGRLHRLEALRTVVHSSPRVSAFAPKGKYVPSREDRMAA